MLTPFFSWFFKRIFLENLSGKSFCLLLQNNANNCYRKSMGKNRAGYTLISLSIDSETISGLRNKFLKPKTKVHQCPVTFGNGQVIVVGRP